MGWATPVACFRLFLLGLHHHAVDGREAGRKNRDEILVCLVANRGWHCDSLFAISSKCWSRILHNGKSHAWSSTGEYMISPDFKYAWNWSILPSVRELWFHLCNLWWPGGHQNQSETVLQLSSSQAARWEPSSGHFSVEWWQILWVGRLCSTLKDHYL